MENNAIKEWNLAGDTVSVLPPTGLNWPCGVAVDGAGKVYFADTINNAIKEWNPANNGVSTLVSSGLYEPNGTAVDAAGNVYFADSINNAIKEWNAAGNTVSTLVSSGLNQPYGVAVDGAGNVYIADTENSAIKEWNAVSKNVSTVVSSGLSRPLGVAVDGSGNLYIADTFNNAIKEWNAASKTVSTLVSSGLNEPCDVVVDGMGNVYFADTKNNAIKELPRAFVVPTARNEAAVAGSDSLPVVLPTTANLQAPFVPTASQAWLRIIGSTNGSVTFSFTAPTTNRTASITLLGQSITINQSGLMVAPSLFGPVMPGNGGFQFSFSNSAAGASFTVLSATNLDLPVAEWTVVTTSNNLPTGLLRFTVPVSTNTAQCFYKLSLP
jgi:DNA-binding beta-propeller fold protein YncE